MTGARATWASDQLTASASAATRSAFNGSPVRSVDGSTGEKVAGMVRAT